MSDTEKLKNAVMIRVIERRIEIYERLIAKLETKVEKEYERITDLMLEKNT